MEANNKSLQALISLLDDPDEFIYGHVKDQLVSVGQQAIPLLESAWEDQIYGDVFQSRIENMIHLLQYNEVKKQLISWKEGDKKDLLEGALIIAKFQYPHLKEKKVRDFIEYIRRDCWLEINQQMTAFEVVKIMNKVFFGTYQFAGNSTHFNAPINSYINAVIETKKGNPLSLSVLYSIVGQQLGYPIYGVNLPNHFILAFMDEHGTNKFVSDANEYGVLFYINAFSRGSIFQKEEINQFLDGLNIQRNIHYFTPCSNTDILKRMLTNLIASYQQLGKAEKVEELVELRTILE